MASVPTGLPNVFGGEVAALGPAEGNYHIKVTDSAFGDAKTGRRQLILKLQVENDPNHQAKEGKPLTTVFQSLPMEGDDPEKAKTTKAFLKRMTVGLGLKWPEQTTGLDPRKYLGKTAWIQMSKRGERVQVVAWAQAPEQLPAKGGQIAQNGNGAAVGGARRR